MEEEEGNGVQSPADRLIEQLEELDSYDVARAIKEQFNAGRVDPNYDEILGSLLGVIEPVDDKVHAALRGMIPGARGVLEADGFTTVALGHTYYEPTGRTNFRPRPGAVYPPSFRDNPPQTDDEARSCLSGSGRNAAFGLRWVLDDEKDDDRIYLAARAKDMQRAASTTRGALDKVLASGLTPEHQAGLLSLYDEHSLPLRANALQQLRSDMPRLLGRTAA